MDESFLPKKFSIKVEPFPKQQLLVVDLQRTLNKGDVKQLSKGFNLCKKENMRFQTLLKQRCEQSLLTHVNHQFLEPMLNLEKKTLTIALGTRSPTICLLSTVVSMRTTRKLLWLRRAYLERAFLLFPKQEEWGHPRHLLPVVFKLCCHNRARQCCNAANQQRQRNLRNLYATNLSSPTAVQQ